VGTRCADHVTPLYPQKLALTSPTGGGRSVGIVRVRTKATESKCSAFVVFRVLERRGGGQEKNLKRQSGVANGYIATLYRSL